MQIEVRNIQGKVVSQFEGDDRVWNAPLNMPLLHQVIVAQQANRRQGTHDTQNRSDVSYSTRKLRPQKKSGRARVGPQSSPILRGGGVAHGPHPRSYRQAIPRKMRQQVLRMVLADKLKAKRLQVLDELSISEPKTGEIRQVLNRLGVDRTVVLVSATVDRNLLQSTKNLPNVKVMVADDINPLETVKNQYMVATLDAIRRIEAIWGSGSEGGE